MNDRIYYSREAEMRASRQRMTALIAFFALGITLGTALALLFAPHSGDRMRGEIADALDHGFEEGRKASAETIERLEKDFADLRKRFEERH